MSSRAGGPESLPGHDEPLQNVVDRLRGEIAELRRSRRRLVEASFADRRGLERALHDGVQQHLVALAADSQRLTRLLGAESTAARALLDEMAANLREALTETTALAQELYPPLLEGRGLATTLRSAAATAGVTINVDVPPDTDYPPEIATVVYWSCVEALLSASPGSEVRVTVRDGHGLLTVDVELVGRHSEGRLERLRDRIEALDGGVSLDEVQDGGSRVHVWLPLSR